RRDGGNEALREVAEAVVVVPGEPEGALHPEAQRDLGVRVVAADHEDERVDEDEDVEERRQREAPVRREEQRGGDQERRDLERPRRIVVRVDAGRDERDRGEHEERGGQPVGRTHGASVQEVVPGTTLGLYDARSSGEVARVDVENERTASSLSIALALL